MSEWTMQLVNDGWSPMHLWNAVVAIALYMMINLRRGTILHENFAPKASNIVEIARLWNLSAYHGTVVLLQNRFRFHFLFKKKGGAMINLAIKPHHAVDFSVWKDCSLIVWGFCPLAQTWQLWMLTCPLRQKWAMLFHKMFHDQSMSIRCLSKELKHKNL